MRREIDFLNTNTENKIKLYSLIQHELCKFYEINKNATITFGYSIKEFCDMEGTLYYQIILKPNFTEAFNINYTKVDSSDNDDNDDNKYHQTPIKIWYDIKECKKIYEEFKELLQAKLNELKENCLKYANHQVTIVCSTLM